MSAKSDPDGNGDGDICRRRTHRFAFRDNHPGKKCCHLVEPGQIVIRKIHLPKGKLCSIQTLGFKKDPKTGDVVPETTDKALLQYREDYAKMALLMFYPFRCINDLKLIDSYWNKYSKELSDYSNYIKRRKAKQNERGVDGRQEGHGQGKTRNGQKDSSGKRGLKYCKIYRTEQTLKLI